MRRFTLVLLGIAGVFTANSAWARPESESTRIGLFLGGRYVPHGHFIDEAQNSGTPVTSQSPFGFEGLLSFAYRPEASIEVALEVGYAHDAFTLSNAHLDITSVPIVASVRWAPIDSVIYPYIGGGGGYMLNFFSGVPSGELENHKQSFHALAGIAYDFLPRWTLFLEDRYQIALPDIVPIGELQTGGNALMLGVSFNYAPEQPIAPH